MSGGDIGVRLQQACKCLGQHGLATLEYFQQCFLCTNFYLDFNDLGMLMLPRFTRQASDFKKLP